MRSGKPESFLKDWSVTETMWEETRSFIHGLQLQAEIQGVRGQDGGEGPLQGEPGRSPGRFL